MAAELVVTYTLRLGVKVEGASGSSFTVTSRPRRRPVDQTSISERIRAKRSEERRVGKECLE